MFLHFDSSFRFCYGFSMFNCFPFNQGTSFAHVRDSERRLQSGLEIHWMMLSAPSRSIFFYHGSFGWEFFLCILRLVEEGGTWWHSILVLPVAIELIRMVLMLNWNFMEVPEHHVIGDFGCGDARLALELKNRQACAEGFSTLKLWGKTNHKPWRSTPLILFRSIAGATFETSNPIRTVLL